MSDSADPDTPPAVPQELGRPFSEFRSEGLLWLVNASVFHPRGYALAFHRGNMLDDRVTGWSLLGDGLESWRFAESMNDIVDSLFRRTQALMPQPGVAELLHLIRDLMISPDRAATGPAGHGEPAECLWCHGADWGPTRTPVVINHQDHKPDCPWLRAKAVI